MAIGWTTWKERNGTIQKYILKMNTRSGDSLHHPKPHSGIPGYLSHPLEVRLRSVGSWVSGSHQRPATASSGGRLFRFLCSLFQFLLRPPGFFDYRSVSLVGRHFLSPAAVFLPGKVSPATFFPLFLLSDKANWSSGMFFCPCSLLLCSLSSLFIFFSKPAV